MRFVVLVGREWAQKTPSSPTQTLTVLKPSNHTHTHTHTHIEVPREKMCYGLCIVVSVFVLEYINNTKGVYTNRDFLYLA